MRKFFRLNFGVLLAAIFFMIHSPPASAGIFSDAFGHRNTIATRWKHEGIAVSCKFSNEQVDADYDFSKMKRVFIFKTDISAITGVVVSAKDFNEANRLYVKKMKCKLVDKNLADAFVEIKLKDWNSAYHHREPEKTVYEAYESYEGYKEVEERRPPPPPPPRKGDKKRPPPPPPPRRHKEWTVSANWFFGSKKVVTPYSRVSGSRKITSSTPFENSEKVVYPAHDVYWSGVTAVFEVRDAKSGNVVMNREGSVKYLVKDYQLELYSGLCYSFFNDFRKVVKQAKKHKT